MSRSGSSDAIGLETNSAALEGSPDSWLPRSLEGRSSPKCDAQAPSRELLRCYDAVVGIACLLVGRLDPERRPSVVYEPVQDLQSLDD